MKEELKKIKETRDYVYPVRLTKLEWMCLLQKAKEAKCSMADIIRAKIFIEK